MLFEVKLHSNIEGTITETLSNMERKFSAVFTQELSKSRKRQSEMQPNLLLGLRLSDSSDVWSSGFLASKETLT